MKIKLIQIQDTNEKYLIEGINEYLKRLMKYAKVDIITIKPIKNAKHLSVDELKSKEIEEIKAKIDPRDFVYILDERGDSLKSVEFAKKIEKIAINHPCITFVIGGAYGFSDEFRKAVNGMLSLSKMTFSHQLIRVIFLEQIYRAFSILNGDPYHNEG